MKAAIFLLAVVSIAVVGVFGCTEVSAPAGEASLAVSSDSTVGNSTAERVPTTTASTAGTQASALGMGAAGHEDPAGTVETGSGPVAKIGEPGERRNPIPLTQEAHVGDWKVKVVEAILDATEIVLKENMFNAPPAEGNRYVLISVEATYVGRDSSTFWLDTLCSFVGGKGGSCKMGVVVPPDSIMKQGETLPGASIAGNLVFEVPTAQVTGGTLLLEEAFSLNKARVFFAVE